MDDFLAQAGADFALDETMVWDQAAEERLTAAEQRIVSLQQENESLQRENEALRRDLAAVRCDKELAAQHAAAADTTPVCRCTRLQRKVAVIQCLCLCLWRTDIFGSCSIWTHRGD
jgi:hypothetical protein